MKMRNTMLAMGALASVMAIGQPAQRPKDENPAPIFKAIHPTSGGKGRGKNTKTYKGGQNYSGARIQQLYAERGIGKPQKNPAVRAQINSMFHLWYDRKFGDNSAKA